CRQAEVTRNWRGHNDVMQTRSFRGSGEPAWVNASLNACERLGPDPRRALGPAAIRAASTGRTHDRTRPMLHQHKKALVNQAPSTHDPFRSSAQPKSRTATGAQRAPEWHLAVSRPSGMPRHQPRRFVDNGEKSLSQLDRAQWRHTIRIVHRHYRAFQRGRRGATLRKGRSMI